MSIAVITLIAADQLGEALAHIAQALRLPVLVLALFVLLVCALELGRFAAELSGAPSSRTRASPERHPAGTRRSAAGGVAVARGAERVRCERGRRAGAGALSW